MPVSLPRVFVFFLLSLSFPPRISAQKTSSQVRILYTGRLFGYYYANDNGPQGFTECPKSNDPNLFSPPTVPFLTDVDDIRQHSSNLPTVLVGTGDNFSPEVEARTFKNPPPPPKSQDFPPAEKEFYSWNYIDPRQGQPKDPEHGWILNKRVDDRLYADMLDGKSWIPADNVACFLRRAHYVAVVPGKHDFHFGAERLRLLARALANPDSPDGQYTQVQMLGANIVIKTSWAKDHEPVPEQFLPAKLGNQFTDLLSPKNPPAGKNLPAAKDTSAAGPVKLSVSNGKSVYPWLQYVDVTDPLPAGILAYLVEAPGKDPYLPDTHSCRNPDNCSTLQISDDRKRIWFNLPASWKRKKHFSTLQPGKNYSLCLTNKPISDPKDVGILCTWFPVFKPFFLYPSISPTKTKPENATLCDHQEQDKPPQVQCYSDPDPFVFKHFEATDTTAARDVAIFGVVDPQMESHVGQWNTLWIELRTKNGAANSPDENNKYTTSVSFEDPVEALRQMMQYFNRKYCLDHSQNVSDPDSDCRKGKGPDFSGTKILLAEMPPPEALSLSISINKKSTDLGKFAAVISSGDDDYATRDQLRLTSPFDVLHAPEAQSGSADAPPAFLVVPPQAWPFAKRSNPPASPLRALQLFDIAGQSGFAVGDAHQTVPLLPELRKAVEARGQPSKLFMDAHTDDKDVQDQQQRITEYWLTKLQPAAARAHCLQPPSLPSPSGFQVALNNFVLCTLQQKTNADIALIQKRDVYWPAIKDQTSTSPPQMLLNAILWKGDFMVVLAIPGGTLQKILKESDVFDQQDTNNLSIENERNRGLLKLGIVQDENKNFIVNDVPLDPGKLYTVATTDYIASGDTGYPELADAVGAAKPQPQYGEAPLQLISAVVCRNLAPVNQCDPDLRPEDYFDQFFGNTPADPRPGNVPSARIRQWSAFRPLGKDPAASTSKTPSVESTVQNRPLWSFALEKFNFSYGTLYHSFSETNLNNNFGGVQATEVTAPRYLNWSADEKLSLTRSLRLYDFFVSQDLSYIAKFTATTSGPSKVNQSADIMDYDGGAYWHLRLSRRIPHLDFATVFHTETQAFASVLPLNLTPAVSGGPKTNNYDIGRTWTTLARLGPRYHDQHSYVEGGIEAGRDLNAIQAFQFVDALGAPIGVPCDPTANNSLQTCASKIAGLTTDAGLHVLRQNRARAGVFWHTYFNIPFFPNITESIENQGDFFFNNSGNNSTDTRLRHLLTEKVTFQVLPNLAFSPTYQVLFYENKIDERFLWQQQAMISVDFSFNLTNVLVRKTEFEYKQPAPK